MEVKQGEGKNDNPLGLKEFQFVTSFTLVLVLIYMMSFIDGHCGY